MAPQPFIVNVTGLKKSGKTAVAEAIIAGLAARGLAVGAVKTTHNPGLRLDPAGTDTRRFADAGASFVIALLDGETHAFERRTARSTLREAARLFPPGVQVVVCEGSVEPEAAPLYIVCLKTIEDLEETLAARGVPRGEVRVICGPAAAREAPAGGAAGGAAQEVPAGVPGAPAASLLDVRDPRQLAALLDLVLDAAGLTPPRSAGTAGRAGPPPR